MSKKKRKPSFEQQWGNLTDIGKAFGLSAIKVGALLKTLNIRDENGQPTKSALQEGLAVSTPTRAGHEHFMWNRRQVAAILKQNGHTKKIDTEDPVHLVALQVYQAIKDGERRESNGEDKLAEFCYEAAIENFNNALKNVPENKRLSIALRLHQQMIGLLNDESLVCILFNNSEVSWQEVKQALLSKSLPAASPRAPKPRF